jgi:hypothetical protein
MAEKKLPEINIGEGPMVDNAIELVRLRAEKAQIETREKELRASVETQAVTLRDAKLEANEIIGLIRVTNERATIRVEFRVDSSKAPIDISQEEDLDDLFGGARPLLFGKSTVVTEIVDPEALIAAVKASGSNPWDLLRLSVKPGCDDSIARYTDQVVSNTAFMPKEGFLATVKDIWHTLGQEAVGYLKDWIKKVIKPTVVVGSKGNGK